MSQPAVGAAQTTAPGPHTGGAPEGSASPQPPSTLLLLVRHAVTEQTGPILSGRLAGIDLSDTGREQAAAVASRLAGAAVAAVYASPIERTTQTAESIAAHHGLPVLPLAGVIEADYGEWTGGRIEDLSRTDDWKVVQTTPSRARFPGGESLREMQARTVSALEDVVARHRGEAVVVVSHADPIKAAIAHFCGMHLDHFQRLHVSPASLTAIHFGSALSGGALLLTCNNTGDIEGLQPTITHDTPATDTESAVRSAPDPHGDRPASALRSGGGRG